MSIKILGPFIETDPFELVSAPGGTTMHKSPQKHVIQLAGDNVAMLIDAEVTVESQTVEIDVAFKLPGQPSEGNYELVFSLVDKSGTSISRQHRICRDARLNKGNSHLGYFDRPLSSNHEAARFKRFEIATDIAAVSITITKQFN